MALDYRKCAEEIFACLGGKDNVISATKSNALNYSMVFWDKIYEEVRKDYPNITSAKSRSTILRKFLF